jgi:hypothetical protein
MPAQQITLSDASKFGRQISLYGRSVSGLGDLPSYINVRQSRANPGPSVALIRAFRVGNFCKELPMPVVLILPGIGEEPAEDDKCARSNELVWEMSQDEQTALVSVEPGEAGELLDSITMRGIEGGVQIENPRFENGRICATIRVWCEIKIFGRKIGFDERVSICIPLEGCHTVWSIEIARLEVCFRAPSDICVKLCAGKWGLEKCWDACTHVSIPRAACIPAPVQAAETQPVCGCH